jgi:hypothetical protein
MANILKSTYNATNEDLKNYFNVKKNNKTTKWSGYGSYSTLTNSEKENLRRNLLNDLSKRVSRNNSAMGIVTYPKINGPSAPPLPNATVMNPNTGKITNVPMVSVPKITLENLNKRVKKLESRSGLFGAGLATLETGGRGAVAGAKAAGSGVVYLGKGAVSGAKAVGGAIKGGATYVGEKGGALRRGTRGYYGDARAAYRGYFNNYSKRQALKGPLALASQKAFNNTKLSLYQLQKNNRNLNYLTAAGITNTNAARKMYRGYLVNY